MKKDLDFANSEIERLRSKLIIDDEDLPSLSNELFSGLKYKSKSFINPPNNNNDGDIDNLEGTNSDIVSLKEAF